MSAVTHVHPPAAIHHVGQRSEEVLFDLCGVPAVFPRSPSIDRCRDLLPELPHFRRGADRIARVIARIRERHFCSKASARHKHREISRLRQLLMRSYQLLEASHERGANIAQTVEKLQNGALSQEVRRVVFDIQKVAETLGRAYRASKVVEHDRLGLTEVIVCESVRDEVS